MEALLEPTVSPNQYVSRRGDAPQSLIGQTAPPPFRQGIVRHDEYQIKIAVWSFLTPGMGPEEVDPFRLAGVDESADDLGEDRRKGLCAGAGCCVMVFSRPFPSKAPSPRCCVKEGWSRREGVRGIALMTCELRPSGARQEIGTRMNIHPPAAGEPTEGGGVPPR